MYDHVFIFPLEEEFLVTECWFQVVQPEGVFVVFGEEWSLYPVRITALNETQDENLFPTDFTDTLNFYLAWPRAVRPSPETFCMAVR